MASPLVSVIMPVYNAERYVAASMESILQQTYTDLQVIVVNDGSTDGSLEEIRKFHDPRIRCLDQANGGVSAALNAALAVAEGTLIARQDADDVSAPERVSRQVARFNADPELIILGTWGKYIQPHPAPDLELERPITDAGIRFAILFDSPFVSSSVMFRAEAIHAVGGFDTSGRVWDDYDQWSRLVAFGKAANIGEQLVEYRVVGSGLTRTNTRSISWVKEQRGRNVAAAIPDFPDDLLPAYRGMGIDHPLVTSSQLARLRTVFEHYIRSITTTSQERAALQAKLRSLLMSCRLVEHHSLFHRAADRLLKWSALDGSKPKQDRH